MFEVLSESGAVTVYVFGEVDIAISARLEATISRASQTGCSVLNVDLTGCSYIDSTGISVLVRHWKKSSIPFKVGIPSTGCVHKVFEICGFLEDDEFVRVIADGWKTAL